MASTHSNRVERARLNSSQAWRANEQDLNPWFQVDFGTLVHLTGLATQGNGRDREVEYVTEYKVGYSIDGEMWQNITESGVDKVR